MTDRRFAAWMAGLIALALATGGVGIWVVWWGSDLLLQLDHFYRSQTGNEIDPEVVAYYDRISVSAFSMQEIASPVLAGTVFALVAIMVVLARRWEVRHR